MAAVSPAGPEPTMMTFSTMSDLFPDPERTVQRQPQELPQPQPPPPDQGDSGRRAGPRPPGGDWGGRRRPAALEREAHAEKSLMTRRDPHSAQATPSTRSGFWTSSSNVRSHSSHWNSSNGMAELLSRKSEVGSGNPEVEGKKAELA